MASCSDERILQSAALVTIIQLEGHSIGTLRRSDSETMAYYLRRTHKVASRLQVTAAVRAARDLDILKCEVRAVSRPTENVVILRIALRRARDVLHRYVRDDHAAGREASGPTVKVILLDVDAVNADIVDEDVGVGDARRVLAL